MKGKDKGSSSDSTRDRHEASPAKRTRGDVKTDGQGSSNTGMRAPRSSQLSDGRPLPGVQHDSNEYNMRHTKRGLALIFNHYKFDHPHVPDREGTDCDRKALRETFQKLGFEVECLIDKTYEEIKMKLKRVSCLDHSEHDCLAVAVLTHGGEGDQLQARDQTYAVKDLWKPFIASECPSLAGKPKLFFIQACRGDERTSGITVRNAPCAVTDAPSVIPPASFQIPCEADFLISYSTFDGTVAIRDHYRGSWYVQTLCNELKKYDEGQDLVSILTDVNQTVAQDFKTITDVTQVPCFISSLTRLLYFRPKRT